MEKFTKGGWEFDRSIDRVVDAEGETICATGDSWSSYRNSKANASLIASAPEMYDDIKRDIDWLKQMRSFFFIGSDGFRACSLRIESKKKLLAKARGEQ